jgi:DnaJ-class molecular chaperone
MRDYYRILGVPEFAGSDEIRRAYRQLARRHHPDLAGEAGTARFRDVREAFETLSDRERRRSYDASRAAWRQPKAVGSRAWFADEVAIDFPSVDALIEQIRARFFGADELETAVSAEILLTPREAGRGVLVPLDVPIRRTCLSCGGRGETWAETCGRCDGSGERCSRHRVQLSVPAGVRHGARFRFRVTPPAARPTLVEVRIAIQ